MFLLHWNLKSYCRFDLCQSTSRPGDFHSGPQKWWETHLVNSLIGTKVPRSITCVESQDLLKKNILKKKRFVFFNFNYCSRSITHLTNIYIYIWNRLSSWVTHQGLDFEGLDHSVILEHSAIYLHALKFSYQLWYCVNKCSSMSFFFPLMQIILMLHIIVSLFAKLSHHLAVTGDCPTPLLYASLTLGL